MNPLGCPPDTNLKPKDFRCCPEQHKWKLLNYRAGLGHIVARALREKGTPYYRPLGEKVNPRTYVRSMVDLYPGYMFAILPSQENSGSLGNRIKIKVSVIEIGDQVGLIKELEDLDRDLMEKRGKELGEPIKKGSPVMIKHGCYSGISGRVEKISNNDVHILVKIMNGAATINTPIWNLELQNG